jgi:hypothetical protein
MQRIEQEYVGDASASMGMDKGDTGVTWDTQKTKHSISVGISVVLDSDGASQAPPCNHVA